jgi:hypothetical protein
MKTIIAGSREIANYELVKWAVEKSGLTITEVVSGCARGVDLLGERWADENGIPVKHFPANWAAAPRRAGHIRNQQMADYADALIAVWDGVSAGTDSMIQKATKRGLKVFVVTPADWGKS